MSQGALKVGIGHRIAPVRFLSASLVGLIAAPIAIAQSDWRLGTMIGFDVGAIVFLFSVIGLYRAGDVTSMRATAVRNDANRAILLAITIVVSLVILVVVAAELSEKNSTSPSTVLIIILTLGAGLGIQQHRLRASLCASLLQPRWQGTGRRRNHIPGHQRA